MSATEGASGKPIVVVGAGHAGVAFINAARRAGCARPLVLVDADTEVPYERPPLSKDFLMGKIDKEILRFHPAGHYEDLGVDLILGTTVRAIDPLLDRVHFTDGRTMDYHALVLATGGKPRIPPIDGVELTGVTTLVTCEDADRLRTFLVGSRDVVLIGAGFIGLEVAAAAAAIGALPVVVDVNDRVLSRIASAQLSDHVTETHRARGVRFEMGAGVVEIRGENGRAHSVVLGDGRVLPADVVVIGAGMIPNVELAAASDLDVADGILVDQGLETSRAGVYAIGDCARFVGPTGRSVRLESVQNATDHAKCLARRLAGEDVVYGEVPWFWSHQGTLKLQIAGLPGPSDTVVTRGSVENGRFSLFWFADGMLSHVESVNHTAGHVMARKLMSTGIFPTPQDIADETLDMKALLAGTHTQGVPS